MLCTISLSRNVRNVNMSYFSWKIFPHLKGYTKHQSIGHMVYSYLQPISQTSFVSCCFSYQDWGPFETMHYLCWTAKSRSNFSRKSYLSITLQKTNSYIYLYYFMPHMYVLFHTIDLIDQSHVNWELEGGVNILMTQMGLKEYNWYGESIDRVPWRFLSIVPGQSIRTIVIHSLLMPWPLESLGHWQAWYWQCRVNGSMSSWTMIFATSLPFQCRQIVKIANIMWCFLNKISQQTVNAARPATVTQNTETKLGSENSLLLIRYKSLPEPMLINLSIGLLTKDQSLKFQ